MSKPIIQTENLQVVYNEGKVNEYHALRDPKVAIFPGEYIILFGPSGCGKSTLLYSILGTLPPSTGKMWVKNEDIYAYDWRQMVNYQRNTIGIIYQSFNLIPSLTVRDNVALPQIFQGVGKAERDRRAEELLRRFGVGHVAHKLTTNLSGGQMQRVAVARSLVNNPQILLADEPVGNLDSISAEQVMNTLEEINIGDGKTVILVTHDAKYLPYAHRIYYMRDGFVEREVINPEKKQIKRAEPGTTIVTEIEKLARLYPYSSIEELRVKSIVNFLTSEMNFDQLERLEHGVEKVVTGRMGEEQFFDMLHGKFEDGGVGLGESMSRDMSLRIKQLVREARDITRFRNTMSVDLAYQYQQRYVKRVKVYLLEEYGKKLSPEQKKHLEEAISDRVSGFTKRDEFELALDRSVEEGGVGLTKKSAIQLTRYLEKLLAQGVMYIKDKH